MAKKKTKVKIKTKEAVFYGVVAAVIAVSLYFLLSPSLPDQSNDIHVVNYEGVQVEFREDPVKADKVQVTPSEGDVQSQILRPPTVITPEGSLVVRQPLQSVTIAFNPNGVSSNRMGYYSVQSIEIVNKITLLYKLRYNLDVEFESLETDDYESLRGDNLNPVIALVHPDIANGTFVSGDNDRDVITISGGDSLEDFDLATVKFMMIALGIDVEEGTA